MSSHPQIMKSEKDGHFNVTASCTNTTCSPSQIHSTANGQVTSNCCTNPPRCNVEAILRNAGSDVIVCHVQLVLLVMLAFVAKEWKL
jgi:hypothetical protein